MQTSLVGTNRVRPAAAGAALMGALAAGAYLPAAAGWASHGPDWALILGDERLALKAHLGAAVGTLIVGVLLLSGVKGGAWHKRLGWTWIGLMAITAVSSFWLRDLNPGSFSWIHALSGWVLVVMPAAVYAARRRRIKLHRRIMTSLFVGGPVIAGAFTLLPGRLLWRVLFG